MSDDTEITRDNGLNPVGKYLIAGVAVLVVVTTVYGIMHTGITTLPATDTPSSTDNAINVDKLREEAQPTPAPPLRVEHQSLHLLEPQFQQPQPLPTPMPRAQATPMDPVTQWRVQKRLKALEAPVMVAAFEADYRVKELPSHTAVDGTSNPKA